ncbi:MAG: ATP-grasp domain-containing protein [Cyclobacteriaceae bacterium]|nr:ATP-grasp domain-containing protein [Cyclobacteriaceae bacterium]
MIRIKKILIANRGEIAVRIIKAAKEMGIVCVVAYPPHDRLALHVFKADEAYPIFSDKTEAYLDIDQLIDVALKSGADAIHPGYGFLSENALFARRVQSAGLQFIGPDHEAIATMGDKMKAKKMATSCGVPVIPGFELLETDEAYLRKQSEAIGFPVLIKARAGGGGKGMRVVHEAKDLMEQIGQAVSEATAAFGDGGVLIENTFKGPGI